MRERIIAANERRIARTVAERARAAQIIRELKHGPSIKTPKCYPVAYHRQVTGLRGAGAPDWDEEEDLKSKDDHESDGWEVDGRNEDALVSSSKRPDPPAFGMHPDDRMARAGLNHQQGEDHDPERSMRPKHIKARDRRLAEDAQTLMSGALITGALMTEALMSGAFMSERVDEGHRHHKAVERSQAPTKRSHNEKHGRSSKVKPARLDGEGYKHNNKIEILQAPDTTQVHGAELGHSSNLQPRIMHDEGAQHRPAPGTSRAPEAALSEKVVTIHPVMARSQLEEMGSTRTRESHGHSIETQRRHHGQRREKRSHAPTSEEMSRKPSLQNLSITADSAVECVSGDKKRVTEAKQPAAVDLGLSAPGPQVPSNQARDSHIREPTGLGERENARPQRPNDVVLPDDHTVSAKHLPPNKSKNSEHRRKPGEPKKPQTDTPVPTRLWLSVPQSEAKESKLQVLKSTQESPPILTPALLDELERRQHEKTIRLFISRPPKPGHTDYAKESSREIQGMYHTVKWLRDQKRPSSCDRLHTPWADNLKDMPQRQPTKDIENHDPTILAVREIEFGESLWGVERFNYGYDPHDGLTKISDNALAAPIRPIFPREEALALFDFGFAPKDTSNAM